MKNGARVRRKWIHEWLGIAANNTEEKRNKRATLRCFDYLSHWLMFVSRWERNLLKTPHTVLPGIFYSNRISDAFPNEQQFIN